MGCLVHAGSIEKVHGKSGFVFTKQGKDVIYHMLAAFGPQKISFKGFTRYEPPLLEEPLLEMLRNRRIDLF